MDNPQLEFLMRMTKATMIVLAGSLTLMGCSKKSGKGSGSAPSNPTLPQDANERAEKVVPADFENKASGVDDVKDSLSTQTETMKGPGANLGLDSSSNPKTVVKTLTGKGLISKAVKTVMHSETSLALAGAVRPSGPSAGAKDKSPLDTNGTRLSA